MDGDELKAQYGGRNVVIETSSGDLVHGYMMSREEESNLDGVGLPVSLLGNMVSIFKGNEGGKGNFSFLSVEDIKTIKLGGN